MYTVDFNPTFVHEDFTFEIYVALKLAVSDGLYLLFRLADIYFCTSKFQQNIFHLVQINHIRFRNIALTKSFLKKLGMALI